LEEELAELQLIEAYRQAALHLSKGEDVGEAARRHNITLDEASEIKRQLNRGIHLDQTGVVSITEEALKRIKEAKEKRGEPALAAVDRVVREEVAKEAEQRAKQIILLGKAVRDAWLKYCSQKGIPVEQAIQLNVTKIIPEALEKAAEYDKLKEERDALLKKVEELEAFADPISRAYKALELWMALYAYIKFMKKNGLAPSPQAIKRISEKIRGFSIGLRTEISAQEIEETLLEETAADKTYEKTQQNSLYT
jgi:hypothetical protein